MAEGARLESVYTGNRIEGSNPSLSASFLENASPGAQLKRKLARIKPFLAHPVPHAGGLLGR